VNTPHDFVVEGAYSPENDDEHGFLPFNVSWYRRHFTIDASHAGSSVWLDFDGVYKNSDVWLNGVYLGHHTSGYVAFRYFLHNVSRGDDASQTPVLRFDGDNVLTVRVDALSVQEGWFYEGGGIYRHVTMTITDPLSIAPWGVYLPSAVTGTITSGPLGAEGPQTATSASVMPETNVQNERAVSTTFILSSEVYDAAGVLVGAVNTTKVLPPGGAGIVQQEIILSGGAVALWNTALSPPLYTVHSTLFVAGVAVDLVVTKIGIRSAVWSPNKGFQLNGVTTPVKGAIFFINIFIYIMTEYFTSLMLLIMNDYCKVSRIIKAGRGVATQCRSALTSFGSQPSVSWAQTCGEGATRATTTS
tara:strand:- start:1645 stop:2721 length:1077 start_codon:yes stop_codon:yes gene_type:complete